jgi:5'-AMP-activated protein kinase catalytic alpha subunit
LGGTNYIELLEKALLQRLNVNNYINRLLVGEHEVIKQKIAAKILQKSNLKTKDLEEKVKREIRFSKYFRHPNIIRLYEVIETNSEIILIMEYAPGGELFDLIYKEKVRSNK